MRRDRRRAFGGRGNRDRGGVIMGKIGDQPFDELKGPRVLVKFEIEGEPL
jgi:hypothetical protein